MLLSLQSTYVHSILPLQICILRGSSETNDDDDDPVLQLYSVRFLSTFLSLLPFLHSSDSLVRCTDHLVSLVTGVIRRSTIQSWVKEREEPFTRSSRIFLSQFLFRFPFSLGLLLVDTACCNE